MNRVGAIFCLVSLVLCGIAFGLGHGLANERPLMAVAGEAMIGGASAVAAVIFLIGCSLVGEASDCDEEKDDEAEGIGGEG